MAAILAQGIFSNNQLPSGTSDVCKARTEILDRLAAILSNLGRAKRELACAVQNGDMLRYESAEFEVARLRHEFIDTKVNLEHHRAQHGC